LQIIVRAGRDSHPRAGVEKHQDLPTGTLPRKHFPRGRRTNILDWHRNHKNGEGELVSFKSRQSSAFVSR